jgi:flagellar biosynthesis/type III secretory pathway protein FliH
MADWCRRPIELGPGGAVTPLVIGPASVPVVDDVALAERDPELAVLSVMAHGQDPNAEMLGRAALLATLQLSDERQVLYSDLVFAALSEAARTALEDLMAGSTYEFQSEFAKKHQAKGRAEGEAKGEAKGRAEGEAKGRAQAVLDVLEARGLRASDEARARILACTDSAQLAAWLRNAATATSVDQVF